MLQTPTLTKVAHGISPNISSALGCLKLLEYEEALSVLENVKRQISEAKLSFCDSDRDEVFNEAFMLDGYVDALSNYVSFWDKLSKGKFADSWFSLQDLQDGIRTIYRFIQTPRPKLLLHLEKQCGHLEKLYPYNFFLALALFWKK